MYTRNNKGRARLGTALVAVAISLGTVSAAASASAAPVPSTYKPSRQLLLSTGEGQMINLPRTVANVWTSNPGIADVYVNGSKQINVFGKAFGEATVIATAADGTVVYGAAVTVSPNISSINEALHRAMPDSNITVTTLGQMAVINGTVASPEDATQAESLVRSVLNAGIKDGEPLKILPVNRLKTATPLQVTLKVRVAEVNRSALKKIGINIFSNDSTGGTQGSINRGEIGMVDGNPYGGFAVQGISGGTTLGIAGKLLGMNFISSLDLLQNDGLVTTLAEPNLTALSGETAGFLAGGEFPIPISQGNQSISVEYKQYGVGLSFTPIVLEGGRISMRVRPEVSELSDAGSVKLGDFTIPALTTRRAETTVELGSGQSFMIAGLLQNRNRNSIEKAPFLGDLPILGALFRSTSYQRDETELVIIVTPYLVKPSSRQLALPSDGYRAPTYGQMDLEGQTFTGKSGAATPTAIPAPSSARVPVAAPGFSS